MRKEIRTCFQKHGEYTYEALQDMKYMHQCIQGRTIFYSEMCSLKEISSNSDHQMQGFIHPFIFTLRSEPGHI